MRAARVLSLSLAAVLAAAAPARAQSTFWTAGTITAAGADCSVPARCVRLTADRLREATAATIAVSGTFTATLVFEGSLDGEAFFPVLGTKFDDATMATGTSGPGAWAVTLVGFRELRVRASALTSGSVRVVVTAQRNGPGILALGAQMGLRSVVRVPMAQATALAVAAEGGGSLAAGTYQVTVVGVDPLGGVSLAPTPVACTVDGAATTRCRVTWTAQQGAASFRVYTSPANGTTPDRYFTTTDSFYNLDSLAGATAGEVPTVATGYAHQWAQTAASWADRLRWDPATGALYVRNSRGDEELRIHNFAHPTGQTAKPAGQNLFIGRDAGNFTVGSTATQTYHSSYNVGVGVNALASNTTGSRNSAVGVNALSSNTTGPSNTAVGYFALVSNTTGSLNTAVGDSALGANTAGSYNTAVGYFALASNTTSYNSAVGSFALYSNTTGDANTALGREAGRSVASGADNQTSSQSVYLGAYTRAAADGDTNEIVIGYTAVGAGSNSAVLGNTSITKTLLRGRVGIGASDNVPTGGAAYVLALSQSAGNPSGLAADTAGLVVKDVAGTAELFAFDEAGNVTQISQHSGRILNARHSSPASAAATPYPIAVEYENIYLGKRVAIDLITLAQLVERLTGQQLVFLEDLPTRESWAANQERLRQVREAERAQVTAARQAIETRLAAGVDERGEPLTEEERQRLQENLARLVVPPPYEPKPVPPWLAVRGVR